MSHLHSRGIVALAASLLAGLLLTVTLLAAVQARALEACDDAFISFRVARNLAQGHGVVFNEGGPPSEAASNFLYTAMLAVGHAAGMPLIQLALALDICFVLLTLLLLSWLVVRSVGRGGLWVPLVFACLTLTHVSAVNGLETTLVGLLLLGAVGAYLHDIEEGEDAWGVGIASALLALLSMTRPEGPLYWLVISGWRGWRCWRERRASWRALWPVERAWIVPFVGLFLPYLLFRLLYFGQLLPNAFHAKDAFFSGAGAKLAQGGIYLGTLSLVEPLLPLGIVAGIWLMRRGQSPRRMLLLLLLCTQCLFMVLSGGDWPHMFGHGRFVYPVLPLCLWLLADALSLAWRRVGRKVAVAAGVCLLLISQVDLVGLSGLSLAPHFHLGRGGGRPVLTRQVLVRSLGQELSRKPFGRWWGQATAVFRDGRYLSSFDAKVALALKGQYGTLTPIAAIQAGQFAYWGEFPFFDLFGLATPGVAHLRDNGPAMMERMGKAGVLAVAFYRWGDDMHNRGVVESGALWRAGYGLRFVLQQGTFRAFVVFERGYKSEVDPNAALTVPLKDLPNLVGPGPHIPIR